MDFLCGTCRWADGATICPVIILIIVKDVCTMPLWIPGLKVDTVDKIGE